MSKPLGTEHYSKKINDKFYLLRSELEMKLYEQKWDEAIRVINEIKKLQEDHSN